MGGVSTFLSGSYYLLQIFAAGQLYDPNKYIAGITCAIIFMSVYGK
jgi:hypothetical protein